MRIGVIFPGQGSQALGMGVDVAEHSSGARVLFDRARTSLGYDLLALQKNGPEEKLRETQYSQPAIFTTNVALYYACGEMLQPVVSAGHSFGELCSLTVSQSLTFDAAVAIVDERGKAMQHAAELAPGGMSAVLGMDAETIRTVVAQVNERTGKCAQLANFNSPTQIVISGDIAAVQAAGEALLEAGAKRVVPLNVSGAWHSRLMDPAVSRFSKAVDAADFALPRFDVVSNVDAQPYRDVETIRTNLVRSISDEVRWHETARTLLGYGLDLVVEFGASPVLGPLMKRLPEAPSVINVADFAGVQKLQGMLRQSAGETMARGADA
ncbi:MAG: ACP S-malonyltransferase [Candidatus Eremiobacteraeota bacterium]|nr:ACP S-malonyltransferase [Candidatus Eremiobacteraeota bacterium]